MALLTCGFHSTVLDLDTAMTVVLPSRRGRDVPLLFLLHGRSGDHTTWVRRTSIERYAEETGFAVVMPAGGNGYWTDQVRDPRWWTFLADELPEVVDDLFALAPPRERTFAAGLSRGGYGALKLGLRHPERFAAVAGLSAKVDIADEDWTEPWRQDVFGDPDRARREGDDLLALLETVDPAACPRLDLFCGTEDHLLEENRRFVARARSRDLPVTWSEAPGTHDWPVWDRDVRALLDSWHHLLRPAPVPRTPPRAGPMSAGRGASGASLETTRARAGTR